MPNKQIIAIVTGASRGAGRGIAVALGSHGAKVYVTGRSEGACDTDQPGTIHRTAREVSEAGGEGVALRCDHADDEQVKTLIDRVIAEDGRIDILVNNACAIQDALTIPGNFWEKPLAIGNMIDVGIRSGYVASWLAAPHMVRQKKGLIVFTSSPGSMHYCYGPAYGAHKAALDKMAFDMGVDFADSGSNVAAVSIWMGALTTERLTEMIAQDPEKFAYLDGKLESAGYTGHVAWAMFHDEDMTAKWNGRTVIGAEAGKDYGITDLEGRFPPSARAGTGVGPTDYGAYKIK